MTCIKIIISGIESSQSRERRKLELAKNFPPHTRDTLVINLAVLGARCLLIITIAIREGTAVYTYWIVGRLP
jgi:hypothetical protein